MAKVGRIIAVDQFQTHYWSPSLVNWPPNAWYTHVGVYGGGEPPHPTAVLVRVLQSLHPLRRPMQRLHRCGHINYNGGITIWNSNADISTAELRRRNGIITTALLQRPNCSERNYTGSITTAEWHRRKYRNGLKTAEWQRRKYSWGNTAEHNGVPGVSMGFRKSASMSIA